MKTKKKKSGKASKLTNALVQTASVSVTVFSIIMLVLNMPIVAYTDTKTKETENISIVSFFKRAKPLVSIEGELSSITVSDINPDLVTPDFSDGLDLPQIIEGQYTVLFLGFDEESLNHDVNWIVQFDIAKATLNILQIPRDTFMGADGTYAVSATGKFNSVYRQNSSGGSPIQSVVNAVQDNFGIPIDAYITTNCFDIVDMVDLVGGIPITLDQQMMYEADKIIPAGYSVLSGEQAEWFVRYRRTFSDEGDIGRVKNQRKFLAAAMSKMLNIIEEEGRLKFYSYLKEIYENKYILTDMSIEDISKVADLASTIDMSNVNVYLLPGEGADYYPPNYNPSEPPQSVWSVHKQAALDMINEHFRPYQLDMGLYNSAIMELVTDYLNVSNDNASDNLEDIQNGDEKTEMLDDYN
ncbi:MAG: LCP family protein [Oscillospiraceae bacterium]|nr:LCP family protein [Oscillospiraceae bacterium]